MRCRQRLLYKSHLNCKAGHYNMFHSFSARHLAILMFVLGTWLIAVSCSDDETEAEAVPDATSESVTEDVQAVTVDRADGELTLEECANPSNSTKEKCCKLDPDPDSFLMKCIMLHKKKVPTKAEGCLPVIKFMSCLIECVYKSKKYIGKGDTLNMKTVQSSVNKLYTDDPRQKEYMIEMYEYCQRRAANDWNLVKKSLAGKVLFNGACKPYYMFVFLCVLQYGKVSCPHFIWKGVNENEEICEDLKEKCEELHY